MSGNDQNEFSKRLERIQANRPDTGYKPKQRLDEPMMTGPKKITFGLRIIQFLFLCGFLLIGGTAVIAFVPGAKEWAQKVPGDLASLLDTSNLPPIAPPADEEEVAENNPLFKPERVLPKPEGEKSMQRMGYAYGSGFAVTADASAVRATSILTGFTPTGPESPIDDVSMFDANENCTLRRPSGDEVFHNINIGYAYQHSPVQVLDKGSIAASLENSIKEIVDDGDQFANLEIARGQMSAIDVIVTDTSGPQYLLLQTMQSHVIWNIHAAPDVEIAHIAVVTNATSGLAGNIDGVSFEAIRASDYDTPVNFFDFRGEPGDLECMARPFRNPNESWGAWDGAQKGNTMDGNLLFGQTNGYDSYAVWFEDALGRSPQENLIAASTAGQVLVGPAPLEPIPTFAPDPLKVKVIRHEMVFKGSSFAREKQLNNAYMDVLSAASLGDPADNTPPVRSLPLPEGTPAPTPASVEGQSRSLIGRLVGLDGIDDKVSMTGTTFDRRVSFSKRLKLTEILQPGEAMPPEDRRYIYALVRTPGHMMQYCDDTLVEIASRCQILSTTINDLGDDLYQVRTTFGYAPNYSIGVVEKRRGGGFISAFLPSDDPDATYETATERRALLVRLENTCEQLRQIYKNCLISTGGFHLDRPARFAGSDTEARAAGWVEVYTLENPLEERNFQERAEEAFAATN